MTYYKAFKLKNGELIGAKTSTDVKTSDVVAAQTIAITDPISFNSFKFMDQDGELVETISMAPLMPFGVEEELEVSASHIFSVATMTPGSAERYESFVAHIKNQNIDALEETQEEIQSEESIDMMPLSDFKGYH